MFTNFLHFLFIFLISSVALAQDSFYSKHSKDSVKWRKWSESTLREAQALKKPLWVHVGFFGCQWCEVMRKESFQNTAIAADIEKEVIPVLVDRFLEPRQDSFWQDWAQRHNNSTGWPLNLLITPDGKPFAASNYLSQAKLTGFLSAGSGLWASHPEEAYKRSKRITNDDLKSTSINLSQETGLPTEAPLFLHHSNFEALLEKASSGDEKAKTILQKALTSILKTRLWDVVSSGFHRYAADVEGNDPHFEKMLNDNARMISVFARASALFRKKEWLIVSQKIAQMLDQDFKTIFGSYGNAMEAVPEAYSMDKKCPLTNNLSSIRLPDGFGILIANENWFNNSVVPECWINWRKRFTLKVDQIEILYTNALLLNAFNDLARVSGEQSDWSRVLNFSDVFLKRFYRKTWYRSPENKKIPVEKEDLGAAIFALTSLEASTGNQLSPQLINDLIQLWGNLKNLPKESLDPSWLSPEFFVKRASLINDQVSKKYSVPQTEKYLLIFDSEEERRHIWRDWVLSHPYAWDKTKSVSKKIMGPSYSSGPYEMKNEKWRKL